MEEVKGFSYPPQEANILWFVQLLKTYSSQLFTEKEKTKAHGLKWLKCYCGKQGLQMVTSQAACWELPNPFANIAAGDGGAFLRNAKKRLPLSEKSDNDRSFFSTLGFSIGSFLLISLTTHRATGCFPER